MPATEAAILERLIEPVQGALTPEAARHLLSLDFPPHDRERMEALAAREPGGGLNEEERAELESYRRVARLLGEWQARARNLLGIAGGIAPRSQEPEVCSDLAPGILRSMQAFWRDLPQLLTQKQLRGQWVLYHGEERVGVAATERELLGEALRRGLREDEYYADIIEPHTPAPWEIEEVEPRRWPYDEDEIHPSFSPQP